MVLPILSILYGCFGDLIYALDVSLWLQNFQTMGASLCQLSSLIFAMATAIMVFHHFYFYYMGATMGVSLL